MRLYLITSFHPVSLRRGVQRSVSRRKRRAHVPVSLVMSSIGFALNLSVSAATTSHAIGTRHRRRTATFEKRCFKIIRNSFSDCIAVQKRFGKAIHLFTNRSVG